ncbi:unnamed protein product [Clonostachys rosea]|uniref:Uncharacterized protein n=1 Tax=Bionectria ochroleuca TaxID=29856 RepID=A0ABY6UJP9_BIOOC|nr:unnamed protein product [Clonostachys rosea]
MATYFDSQKLEYRPHTDINQNLAPNYPYYDGSYELHQNLGPGASADALHQHVEADSAEDTYRPRFFKSVPWAGLFGLVVNVLTTVAIVIILVMAEGKATEAWPTESAPIQLSVILAILIALGNAALTLAFREGAALTWWLKMLKGGNLNDSHRYWQHGSSAFQSIIGLRHFNKVTFVSILTLFLIANPPLLQKSAGITTVTQTEDMTFNAALSQGQLNQPTGYYMTHAMSVNALTSNFSQVVQDFTNRKEIKFSLEGCNGSCSGALITAGFDVNCSRGGEDYDMNLETGKTATIGSISVSSNAVQVPGVVTVSTAYKADSPDKGKLVTTKCTLQAAQVKYPFTYVNGTITLEGAASSVEEIVNRTTQIVYPYRETSGLMKNPSVFGGIAYALGSIYNSDVKVYSAGNLAIQGSGPMRYTYRNFTDQELGSKSMRWIDPTPAVLEAVREVTFRAAIAFSDGSSQQSVQGTQLRTTIKYQIHMKFLGGTLAIILFTSLAIIVFLYHGFWRLGRPVSMSPLEIATAFQAPVTQGAVSLNADADDISNQIGRRRVRYRSIYSQDGAQSRAIVSEGSTAYMSSTN